MKKSVFILAALFAATFANAQITLEATILANCTTLVCNQKLPNDFDFGKFCIYSGSFSEESGTEEFLTFYNVDGSLYKRTIIPNTVTAHRFSYMSTNLFTTDNKIAFLVVDGYPSHLYCYDEDFQLVYDFGEVDNYCNSDFWQENTENRDCFRVSIVNNEYKVIVYREGQGNDLKQIDIYSLPGDGKPQAISTPSSPKRSTRKIAREGQVLVETENNTYTLQGQEVK